MATIDKAYREGSVPEFPDTLIEGFHLLSMVDAVARFGVGEGANDMWASTTGSTGTTSFSQGHRGARVIPTFETLEVTPKGDGYKLLRRWTFTVEGNETPAMVADWWVYASSRGQSLKGGWGTGPATAPRP